MLVARAKVSSWEALLLVQVLPLQLWHGGDQHSWSPLGLHHVTGVSTYLPVLSPALSPAPSALHQGLILEEPTREPLLGLGPSTQHLASY